MFRLIVLKRVNKSYMAIPLLLLRGSGLLCVEHSVHYAFPQRSIRGIDNRRAQNRIAFSWAGDAG
jgi:hypothetical protein